MALEMQVVRTSTPQIDQGRASARAGRGPRPGDQHVYPTYVRWGGWAAVAGVTLAVAWLARSVEGEQDYLTAWAVVGAVFAWPGLVLTWRTGSRVAPADRRVWRFWFAGCGLSIVGGTALVLLGGHEWAWARTIWLLSIALSIAAYGAGNTLIMRARAGRRATAPDVLELTSVVVAIMAPLVLATGDALVDADDSWFAVPWAVITVALVHGLAVAVVLVARIRREDRTQAWLAIALATAALVEAGGQVEMGVSGFHAAAGLLLAWHAMACGLGFAFVLYAVRRPSVGLDRLPPQGQVRRSNVVSLLVLISVPVLVAEAFLADDSAWIVLGAAVSTALLLVMSSLRHLLVARETASLYALVEQAADERRQLLADVLRHVDADRHRVASRLHQQAMTSYSAMSSFVAALEVAPIGPSGAALALAADQARSDLAQQVDTLRDVLATVAPPSADGELRLVAPLRAYVDSLYVDGCQPALEVSVDDAVVPDWTTEVIVLRIARAAIANVHQHADCAHIAVRVMPRGRELIVEIEDDGVGFDPEATTGGSGLDTMRMLAGFVDGWVDVASEPGGGTRVRAVLGSSLPPGARPDLRVVPG
jgi:signal transduction histidine kinase